MPTSNEQQPVAVELKACPFCGSEASPFRTTDESVEARWTWTIYCDTCHASAATEYTEAEAIDAWNTRPSPSAPGVASEAMVECILFATNDSTVEMDGKPLPAMTSLLHRVCGNDPQKFEEATRIVTLFIEAALTAVPAVEAEERCDVETNETGCLHPEVHEGRCGYTTSQPALPGDVAEIKRRIAALRMLMGTTELQRRLVDRDGDWSPSDLFDSIERALSDTASDREGGR